MPKIDLDAVEQTNASYYPPQFATQLSGRHYRRLGPASGLEDFGISHVVLEPGAASSQRHWHEGEDEFLVILSGTAVLVEETGRTVLTAGDCAAFPKGVANGHHLINESDVPVVFIAVGRMAVTDCHYPDADMRFDAANRRFTRKDGTPY